MIFQNRHEVPDQPFPVLYQHRLIQSFLMPYFFYLLRWRMLVFFSARTLAASPADIKLSIKIINVTARTTGIINIKRFAITFPIFISPHFSSVYSVKIKKLIWSSIISAQKQTSTSGRAYSFCIPSESEFFCQKGKSPDSSSSYLPSSRISPVIFWFSSLSQ